jgi:electron transfer flavoprotein beta subunit
MAEDDMQCMVGPLVAAHLAMPCAVSVIHEALQPGMSAITVECEMEGGVTEQAVLALPALLTIQSGLNKPRYPSLSNMLRAKRQEIIRRKPELSSRGRPAPQPFVLRYPEKTSTCVMLNGTCGEKADQLKKILLETALLK